MTAPRTWLPDPSHYPEQMTPLSATTWFEAIGVGLHRAMRELRGPFGGFEARTELGWAYEGAWDPEWAVEPDALPRAAGTLPERWASQLRPRAREISWALHQMRPEQPDPDGAVRMLDRLWDLVLEQWTIHFLAVVPAQAAIELLSEAYTVAFPDEEDPLAAYRLVDHLPNESTRADDRVERLAISARRLGVDDVLLEFPPETALDRLRELSAGRSFLSMLDNYLRSYGGRSRWHELSIPREVERPSMTLQSIRLLLEGMDEPPSADRRAEDSRYAREVLEQAPALAEVLPVSRFGYELKESHVYDIDYPGLLATREALLGFGRRLVAEGRLQALDDVWMLTRQELRAALHGDPPSGSTVALGPIVAERREQLSRGRAEGPRPYLGDPPTDVDRDPLAEKFYGQARTPADAGAIRGTGASAGIGLGPVRVIRSPEDFGRIRRGDVLVAVTTTPAWTPLFPSLAALVTETGGVLSHAAIVAREYGVPTVVGVSDATRILADGMRVRVDGGAGEVREID
jgi:phosphohistidine swiveling domain-containing protein